MWLFNNEPIISVEQMPEGAYGFIYLIENVSSKQRNDFAKATLDPTYKAQPYLYIGKKTIWSERRLKLGKRELQLITDKRKSKYKQVVKESEWLQYAGSCKELLEDVKNGDKLVKTILKFTYSKIQNTYEEAKALFQYEVLEKEEYYNGNILNHFYRSEWMKTK